MAQKPVLAVIGPVEGDHLNRWVRPFVEPYDVHVFTLHDFADHVPGVSYHALPRPTGTRLDFFINLPRLRRQLIKLQPKLIHTHYLSSYGVMAAIAAPSEIPKVLTVWGTDVNKGLRTPLIRNLCLRALPTYQAVNCPSRALEQNLVREGVPIGRIHVFQYGVRTDILPQKKPKSPDRPWRLVSFRDWAPLYRIETILKLFSEFSAVHQDVELHLMGRAHGDEKAKIESLVAASARPDLIHIHGFVTRERQLEILSDMDFMISIPIMDGMPLSLLESCYIGHIPMLSSIPANVEWGSDIDALFMEQLSLPEFTEAITKAKEQTTDMGLADRRRQKVLREADFNTNMKRISQIYDRLQADSRQ